MKIGIVGAGQVGATAAFVMMMRGVGSEIVLVDQKADLAVAQARDILDATPFADPPRVRAGELADLAGARVVVLAAGANQRPGESRLEPAGPAVAQRRNLFRNRASSAGGDGPHFSRCDESTRRHDPDCRRPRRPARGRAGTGDRFRYDPRLGSVPHAARRTSRN